MEIDNSIMTVTQFAKKIKSSRMTVLRLIKEGKIIGFRLSDSPKSPFRIKASEIDRLISWELHRRNTGEK